MVKDVLVWSRGSLNAAKGGPTAATRSQRSRMTQL